MALIRKGTTWLAGFVAAVLSCLLGLLGVTSSAVASRNDSAEFVDASKTSLIFREQVSQEFMLLSQNDGSGDNRQRIGQAVPKPSRPLQPAPAVSSKRPGNGDNPLQMKLSVSGSEQRPAPAVSSKRPGNGDNPLQMKLSVSGSEQQPAPAESSKRPGIGDNPLQMKLSVSGSEQKK